MKLIVKLTQKLVVLDCKIRFSVVLTVFRNLSKLGSRMDDNGAVRLFVKPKLKSKL